MPRAVGDPINTTSGRIIGHASPLASGVSEYLGIPFAQPANGNLRWAPPQRYSDSGDISGANFVSKTLSQTIKIERSYRLLSLRE